MTSNNTVFVFKGFEKNINGQYALSAVIGVFGTLESAEMARSKLLNDFPLHMNASEEAYKFCCRNNLSKEKFAAAFQSEYNRILGTEGVNQTLECRRFFSHYEITNMPLL